MAATSGGAGRALRPAVSRVRRRLRVTFGREDAGHATERIRATTLVFLMALCFLAFGALPSAGPAAWFEESPVDQDIAMRTVSLGWFDLDGALPVTLVDIDERTWRGWNSPAITPRLELVKLIETVSAAGPAVVVVDIDLSWGSASAADASVGHPDDQSLREFLARHDGPPLVFPKRIESSDVGMPRAAVGPFDPVIAGNPQLSWAHASFQTDGDGKVREWRDWVGVCTDAGGWWLPSVATAAGARAVPGGPDVRLQVPPGTPDWDCSAGTGADGGSSHRLLLGPRLSGPAARAFGAGSRSISAATLLDPEVARDDRSLFEDRIVLIGATHQSSGDHWLTTAGVLPGVELLANAVRYSALQARIDGGGGEMLRRLATVALFLLYALIDWRYRSVLRVALAIVATLAFVSVAIGVFEDLRAFEAVAAAIVMMIFYKVLEATFEFVADVHAERARHPAGARGLLGATWKTLRAAMLRPHASASGDSHDQH